MTYRRFWIYFLLFLFNMISYTDRINMSLAGHSIAQDFGLSPVALGYLFSSFLWAYVLMMLPGGADDRQSWSPSRGGDLCDHLVDPEIFRSLMAVPQEPDTVTLGVDFKFGGPVVAKF